MIRFRGSRSGGRALTAAVLLLGATASGAVNATSSPLQASEAAPTAVVPGSWTVLHYSMADNDLEPFMMADINEMGQVGSNENLNLSLIHISEPTRPY